MNIVSKSLLGLTVVGLFLVCTAMLNFVLLNSKFSQLRISSQMSFIKMTQMPFGMILRFKMNYMIGWNTLNLKMVEQNIIYTLHETNTQL